MSIKDDAKYDQDCQVAIVEDVYVANPRPDVTGTVKLTDTDHSGTIIYIPTPTADPQDPLNIQPWQKMVIVLVISLFSVLGLGLVSGFGGVMGFYADQYKAAGKTDEQLVQLMTYPTLTMGIGNLIGMPLALSVGRRPVLLAATIIMVISVACCAVSKTYESHLTARLILGLAAGQSEALVPMISQEIFFLHERSQGLMLQQAIQSSVAAVFVLFASPIAGAITVEWWYGLGACLSGFTLILAIFLVPETKYKRDSSSNQEFAAEVPRQPQSSDELKTESQVCTVRPELDFVNFQPRTWRSDMRLWTSTPEWKIIPDIIRQIFTMLLFPNVFWAMCLNGLVLGVNIAFGMMYGSILSGEPYNWPQKSVSYVNCGQIVTSFVALPIFGWGSDKLIAWFANRRNGYHEPEVRIIPLVAPIIVGIFTCVLFGEGAMHPYNYHWFTFAWGLAAYYFTFVGCHIVAVTYLLDSYPTRAGPLLVIICAFRGIIAFGVTYGITPFVANEGYDVSFNTYAGLTAFFGLLAIPVFIWGKKIRQYTGRWAKDKQD